MIAYRPFPYIRVDLRPFENNAASLIAQRGHVSRESIAQFLAKPSARFPESSACGLA
jgi:hypothetical protein